jgi:tocopherol cyclase
MALYNLTKIFHPARFQGNNKQRNYFEGWYFKVVSADGKHSWAFIPGISFGENAKHSFIQVINGMSGKTWYFKYTTDQFSYSRKTFDVMVAQSRFTDFGFTLQIHDDMSEFIGEISFCDPVRFPVNIVRPGIMGWYRYVPFMECYHGVVSLDHGLDGFLTIDGTKIDFTGGKGYVEKDWGSSMPRAWIWMQTNHFDVERTSFMLSIARIPWLGSAFTGFLGFLLHEDKLYSFATYTGARITNLQTNGGGVEVEIQSKEFSIIVKGETREKHNSVGKLKAPMAGEMDRVIHESINAELFVTLMDRNGNTLYNGIGRNAGLELVGDMSLLQ